MINIVINLCFLCDFLFVFDVFGYDELVSCNGREKNKIGKYLFKILNLRSFSIMIVCWFFNFEVL